MYTTFPIQQIYLYDKNKISRIVDSLTNQTDDLEKKTNRLLINPKSLLSLENEANLLKTFLQDNKQFFTVENLSINIDNLAKKINKIITQVELLKAFYESEKQNLTASNLSPVFFAKSIPPEEICNMKLPQEILSIIFDYLTLQDKFLVRKSCKFWQEAVDNIKVTAPLTLIIMGKHEIILNLKNCKVKPTMESLLKDIRKNATPSKKCIII